jgi:hypothetical protein
MKKPRHLFPAHSGVVAELAPEWSAKRHQKRAFRPAARLPFWWSKSEPEGDFISNSGRHLSGDFLGQYTSAAVGPSRREFQPVLDSGPAAKAKARSKGTASTRARFWPAAGSISRAPPPCLTFGAQLQSVGRTSAANRNLLGRGGRFHLRAQRRSAKLRRRDSMNEVTRQRKWVLLVSDHA